MKSSHRFTRPMAFALGASLILGAAFTVQAFVTARAMDRPPPDLWRALSTQVIPWLTWIPFLPLVQLLAEWIRRRELGVAKAIGAHAVLAVILVIPLNILVTGALTSFTTWIELNHESLGQLLFIRFPTGLLSYTLIAVLLHLFLEIRIVKQAREELAHQQRERLEVLGRLAGGIAHAFNNLLTSIQGRATMLEMDAVTDEAVEDARAIQQETRDAAELTQHLLALGGRRAASLERMDLTDAVRRFMGQAQSRAASRVSLRFSGSGRAAPVRMDPVLLRELMDELVDNAAAASEEGAEVEIRVLTGGDQERWAAIEVEDRGTGMDEETREKAFAPFFSTRSDDPRAGLGLAAVRGIAEQAGGRVFLESEPGRGTLVRVLFPLATSEPG